MLVKEALQFGRVSKGNTKMPGTTFAIDAFACNVGSKLAEIEGTPCHDCYARKLQKLRPSVDKGWKANLVKWQQSDKSLWVTSMVFQIKRYNVDNYHRWFDSGDSTIGGDVTQHRRRGLTNARNSTLATYARTCHS
jgi:hypothetical protein